MFTRKKKRKATGKKAMKPEEMSSGSDDDSSSDSDEEGGRDLGRANTALIKDDDGKEWGKKVDEVQREYISTKGCRTAVSDKHFNNPPRNSQSKDNKWDNT
jgi:hypothetical protein